MPENSRALIKIHGRVQGVFFRAESQKKALGLGLTGWVKNCPDKTVECLVEGEKVKIMQFIAWCKVGEKMAQVSDVEVDWRDFTVEFNNFSIIH